MPRIRTTYDWALETLNDDGDIVDVENHPTLRALVAYGGDLDNKRVALVKYRVLDNGAYEELESHTYAYVEGGELASEFDDGSSVPKARRDEVARLLTC